MGKKLYDANWVANAYKKFEEKQTKTIESPIKKPEKTQNKWTADDVANAYKKVESAKAQTTQPTIQTTVQPTVQPTALQQRLASNMLSPESRAVMQLKNAMSTLKREKNEFDNSSTSLKMGASPEDYFDTPSTTIRENKKPDVDRVKLKEEVINPLATMNFVDMTPEDKAELKRQYESLDAGNVAQRLWNQGIRNQIKEQGGKIPEDYPDYTKAYNEKQQLSKNYNLIKSEEAHDKLLANGMTEDELRDIYHHVLEQDEIDALYAQGMSEDEVIQYTNDLYDRGERARQKLYDLTQNLKDDNVSYDEYMNMLSEYYDNPEIVKDAQNHPVANSIFSVVTNPVESVAAVGKNVIDYATGKPIRRNDTYTDLTRQTVNEQIQNPVGRFFYNTGLSAADSAYSQAIGLAIGGGVGKFAGAGLQGFEKGSQVMNDAVVKGLTPNRIMLQGVSSGLTTFLSELIPMGKLSNIAENGLSKYTAKELAKVIGAQMVTEGAQEGVEDVFDWIADGLIAWDKSDINLSIANYMAEGDSHDMAVLKTIRDKGLELAQDVLGGALSAPFIGGGTAGYAYAQGKYSSAPSVQTDIVMNSTQAKEALAETVKNIDSTNASEEMAQRIEYAKELANKPIEELSAEDVVDMANVAQEQANETNNIAQSINEINYQANIENNLKQYEQTGTIEKRENELPVERLARERTESIVVEAEKEQQRAFEQKQKQLLEDLKKDAKPVEDFKMTEDIQNSLEEASEGFENDVAAKTFIENYNGSNLALYTEASYLAYRAGESGQNFDKFLQNAFIADLMVKQGGVDKAYLKNLYYNGLNARTTEDSDINLRKNENRGFATGLVEGDKLAEFKKALAKKFNIEVFTDRYDAKMRGDFSANLARLTVNATSDNEYAAIVHEMFEFARSYNPKGMETAEKALVNMIVERTNEAKFVDAVLRYREAYRKAGREAAEGSSLRSEANKSFSEAQEEFINDAISYVFSTDEGMKTLVDYIMGDEKTAQKEKVSAIQAIKDWVDKLITSIKDFISGHKTNNLGYNYAKDANFKTKELESLSRMLTGVLDTAKENLEAMSEGKVTEKAENSEKVAHSYEVNTEEGDFLTDNDINTVIRGGKRHHTNKEKAYKNGEPVIVRNSKELLDRAKYIISYPSNKITELIPSGVSRIQETLVEKINKLVTILYGDDKKINIDGFFFQIQPNDFQHAYNEHHTAKKDGDLDMSVDDMVYAMSHFNNGKVEFIEKAGGNGTRIGITLKDKGGYTLGVFIIAKKDGALSLKSMWRMTEEGLNNYLEELKKNPYVKRDPDTTEDESPATVHSRTSSTDNIADSTRKSNTQDVVEEKKSFSLDVPVNDSEGRKLTKGQQEYFKDSKVLDENGNLLRVYHGSMADFTIFDIGEARVSEDIQAFFFSGDKEEASGYGNRRDFYLNITNPADYDTAYDIFFKERKENPSGAGARTREKLIELGYDGIIANDGDSPQYTEYLAFYPEQIKLVTNTKPTKNEDIRYSIDVSYDAAYKNNDTEAMDKLVREAAVAAGFDSPKLYHGTGKFGFTEFDLSKMDDKSTVFLTSNPEIASTYSGSRKQKNIAERFKKDVDSLTDSELVEALNDNTPDDGTDSKYEYYDEKKIAQLEKKNEESISEIMKLIQEAEKTPGYEGSNAKKNIDEVKTLLYLNSKEQLLHNEEINKRLGARLWFLSQTDTGNILDSSIRERFKEIEEDYRKASTLSKKEDAAILESSMDGYIYEAYTQDEARKLLNENAGRGIYSLYAKLGKSMIVDANGKNWNNLSKVWVKGYTSQFNADNTILDREDGRISLYSEEGDLLRDMQENDFTNAMSDEEIKNHLLNGLDYIYGIKREDIETTRDIAKFAKQHGFDSVVFKNIRDNGGRNSDVDFDETADVYALFNPNEIKSADPITYDDNGELIPPSERFKEEKNDIRYSLAVDSNGRKLTKEQQKYFKDSKIVDKDGRLKVMYHGTKSAGFTVFERSDDGISFFFTDNKKVASTYSRVDYFENPDKPMSFEELSDAAESVTDGSFREEKGKIIFEDYDGTTKAFKSIKDAQNWLIDEHIAPMTAQGMGSPSNYEVYLNAKNPLVVNANGSDWNDLPAQSWNKHYGDVDITYSDGTYEVEYMDGETFEWHHDVFDSKKALENKFGKIPELNGFSTAFLSDIYLDKKNQRVPTTTREYAEYAYNNGYDSVIFNDIVDNGIYTDNNIESQVVVVFNPNQIKSIHNENPTENEDIRYSLAVDSDGNELTAGQQSFFKNSKMRDTEGRLKVMYHGTERGGFTVFDAGFSDDGLSLFFTDDADIASAYSGTKEEYKPLRTVKDMKDLIHDSYTDIVKDGDTYKVVYDGKVDFEGNFEALKEYVEEQYGVTKGLNYKVYLNTENPLIVDCEGRNWDELPEIAEGVQTTRDYAAYAYENGYDSVIFNDIYDSGVHASGKTKYKNTQVVVVFDSNQVKSVYNENPTEDSDIRHSIDVDAFMDAFEAVDNDVKLNENELHELIKNRMDLESDVSKKMISEVASNIKKLYNSGIDKKTLERDLTTVFRYLKNTARYSMEDVMTVMTDIAKPILENVKMASPEQEKLYKDFTDFVKGYTIALNNEQMQEVRNEFGSYTNFKRMMAGKMKLDKNGTMLDDVWTEISDRSNGKLSFGTNPNDQPVELARYIMSLNPTYQNLQGQSLDAAATDLALEIFRQFYVQQSMTDAAVKVKDEMSRRSQAMKERYQGVYNAAVKQVEYEKALNMKRLAEEIDNLTAEEQEAIRNGDTVNQALIQNIKNEYQKRYDRLQAESVEKIAKAKANYQNAYINKNLRRERSELKNRLLREVKALQNIIAHPQEGATKHVPVNLIKPTIEMLEAINLDNGGSNKTIVERLKKMSEVYESFKNNEAYSFDYDERIAHNIEELQQMFENKSYADLGITELERVIEIVTALKTQIKNANNLILQGKLEDAKKAADNAMERVEGSRRYDNGFTDALNRYGNIHLNAYREFRKLSGYKDGALMDIYKDLDEGSHREMQIQKELGEIFKDVLEGNENQKEVKKFISTKPKDLVNIGITDKNGNPILITRAMRMSLIMHSMNAGNMRHILGSGITVPNMEYFAKGKLDEAYAKGTNYRFVDYNELLQAIQKNDTNKINELTTAAQKRIEEMKKDLSPWEQKFLADAEKMFHEETGKIINDVSMKLKGYALARVKNYFPIKTDPHFTQKEWSGLVQDGSLEGSGFLKERVISTKPILLEDITNVVERQTKSVAKYGGFAIPVRNFETIMKQTKRNQSTGQLRNLAETIDSVWGASDTKWLRNLMQDIQSGRREADSWIANFFTKLRGNFAAATLNMNLSVAIKQAASYPTAAAVTGWKPLLKNVPNLVKGFGGKGIAELEAINPLLWYREQGYGTQDLADAKSSDLMKKMSPGWQKALGWTQLVDTGTVRSLEYAAKIYVDDNFKNLEQGSEEYWQKVSDVFTSIVEETQPNYSKLQQADVIRNPNALNKMVVMFKTQPMQNFGIVYDALGELNAATKSDNIAWRKEASSKVAKAVSSQVVSATVFSIMTMVSRVVLHQTDRYKDDDDEWSLEKILREFGLSFASCLVGGFIGGSLLYEGLSFLIQKLTQQKGAKFYGLEVSAVEVVNDLVTNCGKVVSAAGAIVDSKTSAGKEEAAKKTVDALMSLAETVGEYTGIPARNIKKIILSTMFYSMDAVEGVKNGNFSVSEDKDVLDFWIVENQYRRIYEATLNGDTEKAEKLTQELVKQLKHDNKDALKSGEMTEDAIIEAAENKILDKYKDLVKTDFMEGDISAEEAERFLVDELGKTEGEAYYQVRGWETGESKYGIMYDNISKAAEDPTPEKRKAVIDEINDLIEHGTKPDTIKSQITSEYKQQYIDLYNQGKAADLNYILIAAYMAAGDSEEEAKKKISKWLK